jgi:hypothetical protein
MKKDKGFINIVYKEEKKLIDKQANTRNYFIDEQLIKRLYLKD